MVLDSYQPRRLAIAYLYPMVPALQRDDNMAFYEKVSKEGLDYSEVNQQPQELALLKRTAGSLEQLSEVRVGAIAASGVAFQGGVPAAFRFLVAEQGSTLPMKVFEESADLVYEAFTHVWGGRVGRVQMVEVSIIAAVAVNDPDGALGFLRDRVTKTKQQVDNFLGRNFDSMSVKYVSSPVLVFGNTPVEVPLAAAHIDLLAEPLLQDRRQLFLNLTVRWPAIQFRVSDMQLPPAAKEAFRDREFFQLNQEAKSPSTYVEQAYRYLQDHVLPFLTATGRN